jgi:hypothetical protein
MGNCQCGGGVKKSSSANEPANTGPEQFHRLFMKKVHEERHPVARKLHELWETFVFNHSPEVEQSPNRKRARPVEEWANDGLNSVSHQSVDDIGWLFVHGYLMVELPKRKWDGKFDYGVTGSVTQGILDVLVECQMSDDDAESFKARIHYYSTPVTATGTGGSSSSAATTGSPSGGHPTSSHNGVTPSRSSTTGASPPPRSNL